MDQGLASGAAVYFGLFPTRRRWESSVRGCPSSIYFLRRPQISPDSHEGRPAVGSRYVKRSPFIQPGRHYRQSILKPVKVHQI